jgi:hypothetical protein
MIHHGSNAPGLDAFDHFKKLEGQTGLTQHVVGEVNTPKKASGQHNSLICYRLLQNCSGLSDENA